MTCTDPAKKFVRMGTPVSIALSEVSCISSFVLILDNKFFSPSYSNQLPISDIWAFYGSSSLQIIN